MTSAAAADVPPATRRNAAYSRKQKSLSLLCSNFLSLYNRDSAAADESDDTVLIGLDDAASRLGVVRRRIYDIVNVLESVGLLSRKSKNTYTWNGFSAVPAALQNLRLDLTPAPTPEPPVENKREKSLANLAQNFVKLFVCDESQSRSRVITLDEAAKMLLGVGGDDAQNAFVMKTKVRRIYDIANVLSSVNLIEKTHASGKPAYRWLGLNGKKRTTRDLLDLDLNLSAPNSVKKTRRFGDDVSNVAPEKSGYVFGPFAPMKAVPRGSKSVGFINKVCWGSLGANSQPRYQNEAMKELFLHYREAWKIWNSQVAETNPIQGS